MLAVCAAFIVIPLLVVALTYALRDKGMCGTPSSLKMQGCAKLVQIGTAYLEEDENGAARIGEPRYTNLCDFVKADHDLWGLCNSRCCGCPPLPASQSAGSRLVMLVFTALGGLGATVLLCGVDPNVNYYSSQCQNGSSSSSTQISTAGSPSLIKVWYVYLLVFILQRLVGFAGKTLERSAHASQRSEVYWCAIVLLPMLGAAIFGVAVWIRSRISGDVNVALITEVFITSQFVGWLTSFGLSTLKFLVGVSYLGRASDGKYSRLVEPARPAGCGNPM